MRTLLVVALSVGMLAAAVPATSGIASPPADVTPAPEDPDQDVIGWEDGYWHNESIDVDQSDGLNDAELDAYVARGMARVEYIRNREFEQTVPVEVMTREEYRNQTGGGGGGDSAYAAWNNQVWEGLFIVGENTDSQEALSSTSGSAVAGFYSPTEDQITIITPNVSSPTISNATLIHELVHALQDQYIDLTEPRYFQGVDGTQDASLAVDGLIEGEANYVEYRYTQRCGDGWSCVETPETDGGGGAPNINFGIYLTIFQPYSDGPAWVQDIVESEGWSGLADRYNNIPASSEQIIHQTDEAPRQLSFQDNGEDGWSSWPNQGVNGADTVGEASIFSMFWYQSRNYGAGIVDWQGIIENPPLDYYDYAAEPSSGWANDLLVPYHRGSGSDAEYGYVWKTAWDTEQDATEFLNAYQQMLDAHDAVEQGSSTWVVEDGPFADAFHIVRDGTMVTIVNAPTVEDLASIRPSISIDTVTTTTTTTTTSTTDDPTTTTTSTTTPPTTTTTTTTTSGDGGPGFTLGLGVVAAVVAGLLARRRL